MSTSPESRSDLRAIAHQEPAGPKRPPGLLPPSARRPSSWVVFFAAATLAAGLAHAIRTLATCGLRGCPETPAVAAAPLARDDETTASTAEPERVRTADVETDGTHRLATTELNTLLAIERNQVPTAAPRLPLVETHSEPAEPEGLSRMRDPHVSDDSLRRSDVSRSAPPAPLREAPAAIVAARPSPTTPPRRPSAALAVPAFDRETEDAADGVDAAYDAEPTPNLAGRWMVTNAIDRTDHPAFRGLRVRFRIDLEQHGNTITGRGRKFTVNDRPVPPNQRNPIVLAGMVDGRDVFVRFIERGTRRDSTGGFRWRLSPDGRSLEGTFDSTVADTEGRSRANREN